MLPTMTRIRTISVVAFSALLLTGCTASQNSQEAQSDFVAPPSTIELIVAKCDLPESKVIEMDNGESAQFMIHGEQRSSEDTVGISTDDALCILEVAGVKESTLNKSRVGEDMVGERATVTFTDEGLFQVVPN